jgi:hypothetical protein
MNSDFSNHTDDLFQLDAEAMAETVREFEAGTLPLKHWNHRTHLLVGLWYVCHYAPTTALQRLRSRIRRYNEISGIGNTPERGYHETITRFYWWKLCEYVGRNESRIEIGQLLHGLQESPLADQSYLLCFYSKEQLMSPQARLRWLSPAGSVRDPICRSS